MPPETIRIATVNSGFAAAYELLHSAFDPSELSDRSVFEADFQSTVPPFVMFARFADPAQAISVICGVYLRIADRVSIGFIEYLVTRRECRSRGHGGALLAAFECEMMRMASARGDRLALILGESVPAILPFKVRHGYRWPVGSQYVQPPIAFDPVTGAPRAEPVPLTLMVKLTDSTHTKISTSLLLSAVRTIYRTRYGFRAPQLALSEQADHVSQTAIGKLYAEFSRSLRGAAIPLGIPPAISCRSRERPS